MVPWRATDEGFVTDNNVDWYRRFAQGRPGVLVVEATGIRDIPSGPLLRIGHERFVAGLRRITDAVHEASAGETKVFIQIIDFLQIRRRPEPEKFFERFLNLNDAHRRRMALIDRGVDWQKASEQELRTRLLELDEAGQEAVLAPRELEALRFGARERVWDLEHEHIRELPKVLPALFADAAGRAKDAGFDGVELHFAHAYTMASFLSARNCRDDGYGGTRENRIRLPLEVIAASRAKVGADFALGCRFLGDEVIDGGSDLTDATWFAEQFARAGLDFLSVSKGGKFEDAKQPRVGWSAYPYTGPSGQECMPTVRIDERGPFGRNLPLAAAIKKAVNAAGFDTPVVAAGGICTFDQAEAALERGDCDIVGAARQSLADPDWWAKMRSGSGAEIRRCLFTNYCEGLDQKHKKVTCQLWDKLPASASGPLIPMSSDGRRRLLPPSFEAAGE